MKKQLLIIIAILLGCSPNNSGIVESTGSLEATQIDIRSEVGGRILKLHYDEGDRVRPGDILAEIDHEKLDYELSNAQARVKELEARLLLLLRGFRDEEVQKAKEALLQAEAQLQESQRDFERVKKLFKEGVASDNTRDVAETTYTVSLKRYEMAKKDYEIFLDGYRTEEVAAAQAAKESAEASVQLIKRKIRDATITSLAAGVVSERYVEHGEIVSSGSLLFSLIDLQDLWIMAYVSEKNLGHVKLGQKGYVFIDSFPQKKFSGTVTFISPEAEFTPKNIQTKEERVKLVYGVKLNLQNEEELLKPGMPADVSIETE